MKTILLILTNLKKYHYCKHLYYRDVYCKHTGLFMYSECIECGKKEISFQLKKTIY